jgi:exopolysaccharide biosynthesis polyprenyl glycosylphosphotransferase
LIIRMSEIGTRALVSESAELAEDLPLALDRADRLQARALLDFLETRDASVGASEVAIPTPARGWLRAFEAVHSSARHPIAIGVDALVLVAVAFAVGVSLMPACIAAASVLAVCYVAGVYADRDTVQTQGVLWYPGLLVLPFGITAFAAIASGHVIDEASSVYVPAAIGALTVLRLGTWLVIGAARRRGIGLRRTLVVGSGVTAATTVRRLGEFREAGLAPVATRPLSLLLSVESLFDDIRTAGIEHVVLVIDPIDEVSVVDSLRRWQGIDATFSMVPPLADLFLRPGSLGDVGGVPLVPLGRILNGRSAFPGKRLFDIVVSGALLILLAPLLLLAALAVKLHDGGPIFYRQRRVGRDGQPFEMLKLRSMVVGADGMRAELEASNVTDGLLFKLARDPRTTTVGALLRRTSIDELPQLWNVLRGDMSLVGPRPLHVEPESFGQLDAQRHAARPGITGYWQVSGGNGLTYKEMIKLDLAYVHNWSIWLDVRLLLRTFPALLNRHGPA